MRSISYKNINRHKEDRIIKGLSFNTNIVAFLQKERRNRSVSRRFNPALEEEGKNPFMLDSKEPKWEGFQDFLKNEVRLSINGIGIKK